MKSMKDIRHSLRYKIGDYFSNIISDIKNGQFTKQVKLFLAYAALIIVCVVVCLVSAGINYRNGVKMQSADALSGTENAAGTENDQQDSLSEHPDSDYDKDENVVDEEKFKDTVLQESDDAGEDYIKDTLFIGDSNTVRMMNYGYTTLENTLAVVGMGIQSVKTLKCVEFTGYSMPVTMVEAVKLMQPRRIIITFGTNNANGMDTDTFISKYNEALDALSEAYPYADILINSVPPFGIKNSYPKLSISSIDKFNVALNEMAKDRNLKFINSSSVMKDESTGYAKPEFMAGDGIHITKEGFDVMFNYIRTHSHITDDTRPKPLKSVPVQKRATYVIGGDGKMRNDKASYEQMSVDTSVPNASVIPDTQTNVEQNTSVGTEHVHRFDTGSVVKEPSYDEEGRREYRCADCGYSYSESIPKKERPKEEKKPQPQPTPEPEKPVDPTIPAPAPDNPGPSNPEPSNPGPSNPEPDNPEPSDPTPTEPVQPDDPKPPEPDNPDPGPDEPPAPDDPEPENPDPAPEEQDVIVETEQVYIMYHPENIEVPYGI